MKQHKLREGSSSSGGKTVFRGSHFDNGQTTCIIDRSIQTPVLDIVHVTIAELPPSEKVVFVSQFYLIQSDTTTTLLYYYYVQCNIMVCPKSVPYIPHT